MACRYKRNDKQQIVGAIAKNGNDSILFDALTDATGHAEKARTLYERVYSDQTKKLFGIDFENDEKALEETFKFTDDNGEPILAMGNGTYFLIATNGKRIVIPAKLTLGETNSNLKYDRQKQVIDSVVTFVNDIRRNSPEEFKENISELLNPGSRTDKGIIANRVAAEAFKGWPTNEFGAPTQESVEKAVELADIAFREGKQAMLNEMPEGVEFRDDIPGPNKKARVGTVMLSVYKNWSDTETTSGWRTKIKDELENFGIKIKDDQGQLLEVDDTPVRIHSRSRLQENPIEKLSAEVKEFLLDIRRPEKNELGYQTAIPLEEIYPDIAEATVDKRGYKEMKAELVRMSKYKKTLVPVVAKLETLTPKQQSAFFTNFANTYNKFSMVKTFVDTKPDPSQQKNVTKNTVVVLPSNSNNLSNVIMGEWSRQSKELLMPNERASYKVKEDGSTTIMKDKQAAAMKAWALLQKEKRNFVNPNHIHSDNDVRNLNEFLWNMSIQFADSKEESFENLNNYFRNEGTPVLGKILFKMSNRSMEVLAASVNKGNDIFKTDSGAIRVLGKIYPTFQKQRAASMLGAGGKTFYPIQTATPIKDMAADIRRDFSERREELKKSKLFNPFDKTHPMFYKAQSTLMNSFQDDNFRALFDYRIYDASKTAKDKSVGKDYKMQNEKESLTARLNFYANNDVADIMFIAVSTQADRDQMGFLPVKRIKSLNLSSREVVKGFILQDLSVMQAAEDAINEAKNNKDISNLIEGYHYPKGENPLNITLDELMKSAPVFKNPQILSLQTDYVDTSLGFKSLIQSIKNYHPSNNKFSIIDQKIEELVDKTFDKLETYEQELLEYMKTVGLDRKELRESIRSDKAIKDFVLNDFYGRIELNKLLRGGYAFAKSPADFYKRMRLLTTPGQKLSIKGDVEGDPTWGMPEEYNAVTFRELDFQDPFGARDVVNDLDAALTGTSAQDRALSQTEATEITKNYQSTVKTDAQAYITISMYRDIQQGRGQWTEEDQQAYDNELGGRGYVDSQGNARPIYPLKPYHEELTVRNGVAELHMDKNSYTVLTSELTANYPVADKLRLAMLRNNIGVANEEGATKGATGIVLDLYNDSLENIQSNILKKKSRNLRFPQTISRAPKPEIIFARQLRKNLLANLTEQDKPLYDKFHRLFAENVNEDLKALQDELGITELNNAKTDTQRLKAKRKYLEKLRSALIRTLKDRNLPDSYLGALDIVPNGEGDVRFDIPLAFPNYQAKFEQIFFSMFNNNVYTQKVKGKELVQVAEPGGYIDSQGQTKELKMYVEEDGKWHAEMLMRASDLGFEPGTKIEDVDPKDPRLFVIGYRIPHQGKNSMLPLKTVQFLPESHEKAIMVPGGITIQMGSDFDVDKMMVMQRPTSNETTRNKRDQELFDTMTELLTDPKYLQEVFNPLDGKELETLAAELSLAKPVDYNNPLNEIEMEMRNKAGNALIGLWANILAGHNVANRGSLKVLDTFNQKGQIIKTYPIIEGIEFTNIGETYSYDFSTNRNSKNFANSSVSLYLSAAVDAASKPIQIDINDNIFTVPVAGLMLTTGVPVEYVVKFLTQPSIIKAIQHARANGYNPSQLFLSIQEIGKEYKLKPNASVQNMTLDELDSRSDEVQSKMLNNFAALVKTGRELSRAFTVLNPDGLDNMNEISGVREFIDRENEVLKTSGVISGIESFINEDLSLAEYNEVIAPIQSAYRNILNETIKAGDQAGFINNRAAFFVFKEKLKFITGKTKFNAETHKFIDRALFLKMIADQDVNNPLKDYMSKERFEKLYKNPNDNIATRLYSLKKSGKIQDNIFFDLLQAGNTNNTQSLVFTIDVNTTYSLNTAEKNALVEGFREMLESSDTEIKEFAQDLVANQLMTSGFHPRRGSYMDLIPSEAFTTNMLNPQQESPVQFFSSIENQSYNNEYFTDFVHDFIRNFGTHSPGGMSILPTVSPISVARDKNNNYKATNVTADYFISNTGIDGPEIYVKIGEDTYAKLQQKGIKGQLNEVGNVEDQSSLRKEKTGETTTSSVVDRKIKEITVTAPLPRQVVITKACTI